MKPTLFAKKFAKKSGLLICNLLLAAPWIVIGPLYYLFVLLKELIQDFRNVRLIVEGQIDANHKALPNVEPSNNPVFLLLAVLFVMSVVLIYGPFNALYSTLKDLIVLGKQVIYFDDEKNIIHQETTMKHSFVETLKFNVTIGGYPEMLKDQEIIGCVRIA
jgi:hypothetical protein